MCKISAHILITDCDYNHAVNIIKSLSKNTSSDLYLERVITEDEREYYNITSWKLGKEIYKNGNLIDESVSTIS